MKTQHRHLGQATLLALPIFLCLLVKPASANPILVLATFQGSPVPQLSSATFTLGALPTGSSGAVTIAPADYLWNSACAGLCAPDTSALYAGQYFFSWNVVGTTYYYSMSIPFDYNGAYVGAMGMDLALTAPITGPGTYVSETQASSTLQFTNTTPVPEPGSVSLSFTALALVGLVIGKKRLRETFQRVQS